MTTARTGSHKTPLLQIVKPEAGIGPEVSGHHIGLLKKSLLGVCDGFVVESDLFSYGDHFSNDTLESRRLSKVNKGGEIFNCNTNHLRPR